MVRLVLIGEEIKERIKVMSVLMESQKPKILNVEECNTGSIPVMNLQVKRTGQNMIIKSKNKLVNQM